jgi:serine/threonine protein kinase
VKPVFFAQERSTSAECVLKQVKKERLNEQQQREFVSAMRRVSTLKHKNILTPDRLIETADSFWLAMAYCNSQDLYELTSASNYHDDRGAVGNQKKLKETVGFVRAVLDAAEHLHANGVIHRDIKPDNVAFHSENGQRVVKLIDFDLAATTPLHHHGVPLATMRWPRDMKRTGTWGYIPPEGFRGAYCPGSDVWQVGCVLYYVLVGYELYEALNKIPADESITPELQERATNAIVARARFPNWTKAVKPVCQKMLSANPEDRPSAAEAQRELAAALRRR